VERKARQIVRRFIPRQPAKPIDGRLGQRLKYYWRDRMRIVFEDEYAGIPMIKFPEDLRVYEHLIWESKPSVVIEIGSHQGGSALWFRDRLRTLAAYGLTSNPQVISIDLTISEAVKNVQSVDPHYAESITFLEADVTEPSLASRVRLLLPGDARCMVVDDSAHTWETTTASLRTFASYVPIHGYFIVEDGSVDIEPMRIDPAWPRGVLPAIEAWLQTKEGSAFTVRRDLERYIVTSHPRGFLQRQGT
jgi:cephalosporin hydroxylase